MTPRLKRAIIIMALMFITSLIVSCRDYNPVIDCENPSFVHYMHELGYDDARLFMMDKNAVKKAKKMAKKDCRERKKMRKNDVY